MKVTVPTSEGSDAERSSFATALEQLTRYRRSKAESLTAIHDGFLWEIETRIATLAQLYDELMEINSKAIAAAPGSVQLDPLTDTITFRAFETELRITLERADPNVPPQMRNLGRSTAYLAGSDTPLIDPALRSELESKLESFYQGAHRVLKLFGEIDELAHIRCLAVTLVRNGLIEHPPADQFYSFGVGPTGPLVKPMRRGDVHFHDMGLGPNAKAWCDAIADGLSRALQRSPND